jgi:hypothetical protein
LICSSYFDEEVRTMKFNLRLFRKSRFPAVLPLLPEFGVRVTLRRGDKIVRRDPNGVIVVTSVTSDRTDATEMLGAVATGASGRASSRRARP